MKRVPKMAGLRLRGMPSSVMPLTWPGEMISPGCEVTTSTRSSSVLMGNANPVRASARESCFVMRRSSPSRLKTACGTSWITKTTSPAARPGASLPLPWSVTASPWRVPGRITNSIVSWRSTSLAPAQSGQRSALSRSSPSPRHSGHACCICCTIPGPI
eukprot:Amastigsp_a677158_276.p3 type:complete len:159 gc:universal Amastigsp_a677158_276:293-769(+)